MRPRSPEVLDAREKIALERHPAEMAAWQVRAFGVVRRRCVRSEDVKSS
jgi:hypothetical protein